MGFSSISSLLDSSFWLAAGLPPWLFSFRVSFLHRFIWPSPAPSLSLLAFPFFMWCYSSLSCPLFRLWCCSTCLHDLLLLGVSCSFFAWVPGCFVPSASCCLYAVLLSSWASRLRSRLPPSSSFLLEFLSCAPACLSLAISFLQFFLLWSPSRRFGVCLPWLLSLPFQCATISFSVYGRLVGLPGFPALRLLPWFTFLSLFPLVRHFLSFFRRSFDSVESPLHYATGSPFGPSQLLVSLLAFFVHWPSPA